jgi:acyl-CoA synthetase (AMP-forming)/AMP-acid ligase II
MADLAGSGATWYSAVPTMHQAILARAARNPGRGRVDGLRFIRSSSAALPPRVLGELETAFGVPVIEAYGMTEAAHQMASNPLPPGERKPGTVGRAAGPEVAIMDESGALLPPGRVGEIVIRGPNVFRGYEHRPEANAAGFTDGWFRTGDAGTIDQQGYVTITGRLKEIINRGGEKISPREIDEVLLEHEAVQQAVAFPVPHPALGETVGAAVVLREGMTVTERELLAFVAGRVAAFKVPAALRILDDLPRGATGKVRRIDMARLLGFA